VTLRTCRALPLTHFELAPCVHVGLRRVVARGAGAHIAARTEASMWVAAGVGIQARVALTTWLALLASAGGENGLNHCPAPSQPVYSLTCPRPQEQVARYGARPLCKPCILTLPGVRILRT
jgi:hypothetical protein